MSLDDGGTVREEPSVKGLLLPDLPQPRQRNRLATLAVGKVLSDRLERYAAAARARIEAL